jgi:hypothetical protein
MGLVGNTHLVAGTAEAIPQVLALLEREGIETRGNPDIYIRTHRQFGAEDARELRERAGSRAVNSPHRIFIVAMPGMTTEAQNTLLKTLEEPPAGAMFFLIVPAPDTLLATLRSRAQVLTLGARTHEPSIVDAKMFLAATPQERLDMLKPLLEKDDDDKRDAGAILSFLSSVERMLEKDVSKRGGEGPAAVYREGIESVYRARRYMGDKGALVKPLLEQVALLVPKA